jgi:hypothetical protein
MREVLSVIGWATVTIFARRAHHPSTTSLNPARARMPVATAGLSTTSGNGNRERHAHEADRRGSKEQIARVICTHAYGLNCS